MFRYLLHMLVSMTLILNGSGLAMASSQMHAQHATAEMMDAATDAPIAHGDCKDHVTAVSSAGLTFKKGDPDHSELDCCSGAMCAFACAAGAATAITAATQPMFFNPHAMVARAGLRNCPTPALQVRYRPPIV